MEIKEKTKPCSWLMLGHGRNDRYMYLSICCVPQGIKSKKKKQTILINRIQII